MNKQIVCTEINESEENSNIELRPTEFDGSIICE